MDYAKSLEKGYEAALERRKNGLGIIDVFHDLSRQISVITEECVEIDFELESEKTDRNISAIAATNVNVPPICPSIIGKYKCADFSTFLVSIGIGGNMFWDCRNAEELESALAKLLEEPEAAETIMGLKEYVIERKLQRDSGE